MSYRPKVKGDAQGTVTDLPLDAETVKGVDVVTQLQNKSNVGHTHSSDSITKGYLNVHPENSPTLIPFINNDISFLLKRGGSVVVKYDDVVQTINTDKMFDGSPSYWGINPTNITTIVIEITLHKTFAWGNTIYVDFGATGWRAKSIKLEVMNSNYPDDVWTQKGSTTTNASGHYSVSVSHTPVGGSSSGNGFNKIRYTFSTWATATSFRIAQIGIYNYDSGSLRETSMSRGIDDYIFRSITPNADNTYTLGNSTHKWSEIHGALKGTADNASKLNNQEASYYLNYNNLTNKPTIPSAVTESTVAGWGFTKNTGTVTSVSAGTGLSISGTASTTPTVNVASGYKLLTTTEYNTLNAKVSNVQSDWNATTGLARILNKPDILPITNYTNTDPVYIYNLSAGRYINASGQDIVLFYTPLKTIGSHKWKPGRMLLVNGTGGFVFESWSGSNVFECIQGFSSSTSSDTYWSYVDFSKALTVSGLPESTVNRPVYVEIVTNEYGLKQYFIKECNTYAGATKVTLNGTDFTSSPASFYAPTSAGTSGQFLKSAGANASPTWVDLATVNDGTLTIKGGTTDVATFTANQSGNSTFSITAGSNVSLDTGTANTIKISATDTKYNAGTGLTLSNNVFSVTSANVSTMLNLLTTGGSTPSDNDYYISQYAGGTQNTYHRRPVSALYTYMKGKFDSVYQTKISKLGSLTQPIYFDDDGVASTCTSYAGGTAVTLNGSSKVGSTASFYAPTSAGTSGYSLKSNGSGAPRWAYSRTVQVSGAITTGAKNCASVSLAITSSDVDRQLHKGLWYYSGTYGVFIVYLTTELTTAGSSRTEYISGYVTSQISSNTTITLVEL